VSALQFHSRRIAIARRAVRELSAFAEQRAAAARKRRAGVKFRPLSRREATEVVGADLLARLAAAAGRS